MIFGAFVLTFRRPEGLKASLDFLLRQTRRPDQIWVIDNADDPATAEAVAAYEADGVRYHANPENLGSAGGVATGFERLAAEGCDWILSVDDDDAPAEPEADVLVEHLIGLIDRRTTDHNTTELGIVGAAGSRFDWQTGEHVRVPDDELTGDVEVDIIGGGSLLTVSREVLAEIGAPNKEFFFGHYDPLFCLEAKRQGYRVMVEGDVMRLSRTLNDRLGIVPVRRTMVASNPYHSLWRRYYVTRNYIFAMRRTFDEPRLARRMAVKSLLQSVLAFGRGPRYGSRYTTMQVRGIIDGYRGRLGRVVAPVAKPSPA